MSTTHSREAHLEAVLESAVFVLGARQDRMLGLDEWLDMARAVAACIGCQAAALLTDRDLEEIAARAIAWDVRVDGALPGIEHA